MIRYLRLPYTKPCRKPAVANSPSSPISSYIRVSWAYCVRNALNASSVAAIIPARRPNRLQPAQKPTGIVSSPNTSDSACVADSLAPKTCIQTWSSM